MPYNLRSLCESYEEYQTRLKQYEEYIKRLSKCWDYECGKTLDYEEYLKDVEWCERFELKMKAFSASEWKMRL